MNNPTIHSFSLRWLGLALLIAATLSLTCTDDPGADVAEFVAYEFGDDMVIPGGDGPQDGLFERSFEVLLTEPHCDVCTGDDKDYLQANSRIVERVVELIDGAEDFVDIAQFTFSARPIEEAIYRAHERGVTLRVAMDHGQERSGSLSQRMKDNGVNVRFVRGVEVPSQNRYGLMHSKFMIVDGHTLLTGSNNWSSTGTTINEENTLVMSSTPRDELIHGFRCHFEAAWQQAPEHSGNCSTTEAYFSPGIGGRNLIRDEIADADSSVHVLMHHLLFNNLVRELADAAERGVEVRIVLNAEDRETYTGGHWDRLVEHGGELRFKQNNPDEFQYMHHKLAIIDGETLLHGSGNWSGSGFFNNYEFYVRYDERDVVDPFNELYRRLWNWSLTTDSLDTGSSAARQHYETQQIYFGNLHAHIELEGDDGKWWDDGELLRRDGVDGELYSVDDELDGRHPSRHAWEYARDTGHMDFMAISPHVSDERSDDAHNHPNMTVQGFETLLENARAVTEESQGQFVAIPAMEWNTMSGGNHVGIMGTETLAKVERGRFDLLYESFLPDRVADGERPLLQFNHPRTFRQDPDILTGNWDQIFDVNLLEIPNNSQRRRKFTDFGLDDYPPLKDVRQSWIDGEAMPDRQIVSETLQNIEEVTRPYLRLMEVTIGRGTDIAHEDGENPSWTTRDGEPYHYTRVDSDWHYYLLQGFRLAPAANHDNHYANWGSGHTTRTAIYADELSERALLDGVDQRLVYATEDPSLKIGFYAANRIPMGSTKATLNNQVHFNLYLDDPGYEGSFEVRLMYAAVGADQVVARTQMSDVSQHSWYGLTLPLADSGKYFAYVEVYNPELKRTAWTAPIWITRL